MKRIFQRVALFAVMLVAITSWADRHGSSQSAAQARRTAYFQDFARLRTDLTALRQAITADPLHAMHDISLDGIRARYFGLSTHFGDGVSLSPAEADANVAFGRELYAAVIHLHASRAQTALRGGDPAAARAH